MYMKPIKCQVYYFSSCLPYHSSTPTSTLSRIALVKMRASILSAFLLQATLILAKPYSYETNGIVYDLQSRNDASSHRSSHSERAIGQEAQVVEGAYCLPTQFYLTNKSRMPGLVRPDINGMGSIPNWETVRPDSFEISCFWLTGR